jgi:DNA polymerase (family X)
VEIKANAWLLDLDSRRLQRALELGCMMSINPHAHSTREIDLTHLDSIELDFVNRNPKRLLS